MRIAATPATTASRLWAKIQVVMFYSAEGEGTPGYDLAALSLADTERLPGVEHGCFGTMRST